MELIDLGVGEPDAMADEAVVRILAEEAKKPENRFYADNGILEFKQAAANYMKDVFGVDDLDPETEINHVDLGQSRPWRCFLQPSSILVILHLCHHHVILF